MSMKVKGLDGRTYTWQLVGHDADRPTSKPHKAARVFLASMFPVDRIIEELELPGSRGLRADFLLPRRKLLVEVHGRQHFEFVSHFHGDKFGFAKSLRRDANKVQWANINGLGLAQLDEGGTEGEWREAILNALGGVG